MAGYLALVICLFLAASSVLTVSQAWVLGTPAPRRPQYVLAWLGGSVILAWALGVYYGLGASTNESVQAQMSLIIVLASVVIAAVALWRGARRGARLPASEPFLGRILAVGPIHLVVVFVGSLATWIVVGLIVLSHIH
jgi:hypothetical protein